MVIRVPCCTVCGEPIDAHFGRDGTPLGCRTVDQPDQIRTRLTEQLQTALDERGREREPEPELLTLREVARLLRCSRDTVWQRRRMTQGTGLLLNGRVVPEVHLGGRLGVRFRRRDLERAISGTTAPQRGRGDATA